MIPELYAEMHLVFDNDFDVNEITEKLGIEPFECKSRLYTRINPITQKYNPGFWTIKSETFCGYDVKVVLDSLILIIKPKLSQIKTLCEIHDGQVFFDLVPLFYPDSEPTIYFDKDFLKIVNYLDAEIRLDMYVQEK